MGSISPLCNPDEVAAWCHARDRGIRPLVQDDWRRERAHVQRTIIEPAVAEAQPGIHPVLWEEDRRGPDVARVKLVAGQNDGVLVIADLRVVPKNTVPDPVARVEAVNKKPVGRVRIARNRDELTLDSGRLRKRFSRDDPAVVGEVVQDPRVE